MLLSLGVPWEVIQSKPAVWRRAAVVAGREIREGLQYDFEAGAWLPIEPPTQ